MREETCCFTGHREISRGEAERLAALLDEEIERLAARGVRFFGAGGAEGFDTLAAQAVLRARTRRPELRLILVLPFPRRMTTPEYDRVLRAADKVVYVSPCYREGCYHARNRRLAEGSGVCVAYLRRGGGTGYTVDYCRKLGVEVINLAQRLER